MAHFVSSKNIGRGMFLENALHLKLKLLSSSVYLLKVRTCIHVKHLATVCHLSWVEEEYAMTICDHQTSALWRWYITFIFGKNLA